MAVIWSPVRTLGGACDQVPTALDKETLGAYAEKCGKETALKWASSELGVDVAGCAKSNIKEVPECVANNYGITFDVVNKDGSVNWNAVVRDSGAVAGIIVCAATGAGAAALPLCGKLGAELATALVDFGKGVAKVCESILSAFGGSGKPLGYACGKSVGYVLPQYAVLDIVSYLKIVKTIGGYPAAGSLKLGPVMPGTQSVVAGSKSPNWPDYWGRLFLLRGLAQATASLISEISRKAGVSPVVATQALAPAAPPGWSDLVRPLLDPVAGPNKYDQMGNIGGLFNAMLYGVTKPDVIRPSWQKLDFWSGIDTVASAAGSEKLWRYFSITVGCPNNTVVWGEVQNFAAAKPLLAAARDQGTVTLDNKTASNRWNWWVYSMPKALDQTLLTLPDDKFKLMASKWRASLEQDLNKKIAAARGMSSPSSTSSLPKLAAAGAGLAAAGYGLWWWFFKRK